jgi:murein L,D-transpeptidase YcbB/YkuD
MYSMRGLPVNFNFVLAGLAVASLLAMPGNALAGPVEDEAAIEAAIPVPEPVNLPPPTVADFSTVAPRAESTAEAAKPATPVPESASPAPPEHADGNDTPSAASMPKDIESLDVKLLTGKDLVKAPISSGVEAADLPVAEKLRDLLANQLGKLIGRENERAAIEAFYRDRGFAPLWTTKGSLNQRASSAIAHLHGVATDGLNPTDYPIPDFTTASDPGARAEADIALTDSVLTFVRHARTGRVHFTRVSGAILYQLQYPDPADVLSRVAAADDVGKTLDSYHPQQPGYKALKAKLAEAGTRIGESEETIVRVPEGPMLRPGMEDTRVPILRKRLKMTSDPDSLRYDEEVVEAVQSFQREAGLSPDGLVGPNTLTHLNGGKAKTRSDVVDTIIANMERWRWLPRDLGTAYAMLNIPDYTLKVVDHGKTVWSTRVVVGKPGRMATPLFSETIKYITINPTWNVPPSIIKNEYLPALEQDPDALDRIGLKVVQNRNGTIRVYQPPGAGNALGRIRFNFPNKFLVYQHDTPDKHLFARAKRAYSHGCMRVQDPDRYAEVLLSLTQPTDGYTIDRIRRMYGTGERNINLDHPMPVHLTYQTAFVDDTGRLQLRDDVYGRDAQILALLKGSERQVADVPIVRRNSSTKPVVARLPQRQQYGGFGNFFQPRDRRVRVGDAQPGGYNDRGPGLFDFFFR